MGREILAMQVELGSVAVAFLTLVMVIGAFIGAYVSMRVKQTEVGIKVDTALHDVDAAWNRIREIEKKL